jgi:hypothetical protein
MDAARAEPGVQIKAATMSVFRSLRTDQFFQGTQDGVVAKAGGGQTNAFALTATMNRIATVATAGDSVKLPPAKAGLMLLLVNHGANPMQVFGTEGDTINDVASATGVSQMQNSSVFYVCFTEGAWYTESLASGFSGGLATFSSTDAITAFATGGQANAVLLTSMYNRVTVVGSANDSVKLPLAQPGMEITVTNAAAANSLNIFPSTGDAINALAANAAFAMVVTKTVTFYCSVAGKWHTMLTA